MDQSEKDEINRRFYEDPLAMRDFSQTRDRAWPGWNFLSSYLKPTIATTATDLGCGNGRLYPFLNEHLSRLEYCGVDRSPVLIQIARNKYPKAHFLLADLLTDKFWCEINRPSTLVTLFAVLHHIPSQSERVRLLSHAAHLLRHGGLMVFSVWNFAEALSKSSKVVALYKTQPSQCESGEDCGDYIVYWKQKNRRFCHQITPEEADLVLSMLRQHGLSLRGQYRDQSKQGVSNDYYVLERVR